MISLRKEITKEGWENQHFLFANSARSNAFSKEEAKDTAMAIDTLLSAAHLRRELGEDLFAVLVSSDNTAVVRKLAEERMKKVALLVTFFVLQILLSN